MQAEFVDDWDVEQKEYEQAAPPLAPCTVQHVEQAHGDLQAVAGLLKSRSKRKAAPSLGPAY